MASYRIVRTTKQAVHGSAHIAAVETADGRRWSVAQVRGAMGLYTFFTEEAGSRAGVIMVSCPVVASRPLPRLGTTPSRTTSTVCLPAQALPHSCRRHPHDHLIVAVVQLPGAGGLRMSSPIGLDSRPRRS
jgi:hypothetical protein